MDILARNFQGLSRNIYNGLHALENCIGEHLGMSFLRLEDNSNACHWESSQTSYDPLHQCCLAVSSSVRLQNFICPGTPHPHLVVPRENGREPPCPSTSGSPTKRRYFHSETAAFCMADLNQRSLSEHTHAEAQVSVHFRPARQSRMVPAHTNLYASGEPHSRGMETGLAGSCV
jgi:hypothetical protein